MTAQIEKAANIKDAHCERWLRDYPPWKRKILRMVGKQQGWGLNWDQLDVDSPQLPPEPRICARCKRLPVGPGGMFCPECRKATRAFMRKIETGPEPAYFSLANETNQEGQQKVEPLCPAS